MFGLKTDWSMDVSPRYFTLEDYEGGVARWCPGCGDHAVLSSVHRILRDEQLKPEKIVAVSGIGCSSRFPHYLSTYGFHGLHGRALPVACGVKARRPDLNVWVATGDGDCCSIGAGHWVHAIRYNMDLVVMLFDNNVDGLTKNQTSPTSPVGLKPNTHPRGAWLPPINPIAATLGFTNVSFVARTVDWNPIHLRATLYAAYKHRGLSFVQILQRCPQYTGGIYEELQNDPSGIVLMKHANGVPVDPALDRMYKNQLEHDPSDMNNARRLADIHAPMHIGLFYRNPDAPVYEDYAVQGMDMTVDEKLAGMEIELDRFKV